MKGIIKANLFIVCTFIVTLIIRNFFSLDLALLMGVNNYMMFIQYILFLPLIIVFLIINRESPKKVLKINKISFVDIVFSILIAFLAHPVAGFFSELTGLFFDNPVVETFNLIQSMPFPAMLFTMAITPAICEELITRGIFLHGYEKSKLWVACFINGLVFSMLHMDFQQSLYTFLLGMVFAYMVKATNSIWSSVLCHFTFNAVSVYAQQIAKTLSKEELEAVLKEAANRGNDITSLIGSFIWAIPFAVAIVYILRFMYRRNNKNSSENSSANYNILAEDSNDNFLGIDLTVRESKGIAYLTFGLIVVVYAYIMFSG